MIFFRLTDKKANIVTYVSAHVDFKNPENVLDYLNQYVYKGKLLEQITEQEFNERLK